jgi:hypothetical protein
MQSRSARVLQASCMGPPAPKNGAIRMTKGNGIQQFLNRSKAAPPVAFRTWDD